MENPDQPVWDHRYDDSGPIHDQEECGNLSNELCNRLEGSVTVWHILVKRLTEYYEDHADEFYEDYKEIHG